MRLYGTKQEQLSAPPFKSSSVLKQRRISGLVPDEPAKRQWRSIHAKASAVRGACRGGGIAAGGDEPGLRGALVRGGQLGRRFRQRVLFDAVL
jgi:hypothetical protein